MNNKEYTEGKQQLIREVDRVMQCLLDTQEQLTTQCEYSIGDSLLIAYAMWQDIFDHRYSYKLQSYVYPLIEHTINECTLCEVYYHCVGCPLGRIPGTCAGGSYHAWCI